MSDHPNDHDARLRRRLGSYVDAFDAPQPPDPERNPRRRRAHWLAVLATGAAAVAVGATAAIVLLDGPRSNVADATVSPSASETLAQSVPVVSAEPTETAAPSSAAPSVASSTTAEPTFTPEAPAPEPWTLARVVPPADDPSADDGAVFFGVEWHARAGFMAYGIQENRPDGLPGIWTSGDGAAWRLAALPEGMSGYRVSDIAATTEGSGLLVAVAYRYEPSPRATVFVSDDGATWAEAQVPDNATYLESVTYGPIGFVAVGYEPNLDTFASDGRVWHSADGRTWSELDPPSLDGADLLGVEVVGERYVAAGFPDRPSPPMTAWVSADGLEWSSSAIVPSSGVGCICAATGSNGAEVIVAGLKDETFVASSTDGATWIVTAIDLDADGARRTARSLDGLAVLDDGTIVGTGSFDIADGPKGTLIWVRDAGAAAWRSVAWRDHLPNVDPAQVDLGRPVYAAVAEDRTVVLLADGTVLITSGRTP